MKLLKLYSVTSLKSKTELLTVSFQFTNNDIKLGEKSGNKNFLLEIDHNNSTFYLYSRSGSLLKTDLRNAIIKSLIKYFTKTRMLDYLAIILTKKI
jgi:hypothetical protein